MDWLPQYVVGEEGELDECQWGLFIGEPECTVQATHFVADTKDDPISHIGHYCAAHIVAALAKYTEAS